MADEAGLPPWPKDLQSVAYTVSWLPRLGHSADVSLGDRPREIGVHVTPSDFSPEQLKEVLTRTKGLWNEKTLARLAVPEMLE